MSNLRASPDGVDYDVIPDGDKVRYADGDSWEVAQEARYCNGSAWIPFWTRSNPLTVTFYPNVATSLRWNGSAAVYDPTGLSGDNARSDMHNGRFSGSASYHYTSLMRFATLSNEGQGSIATILGTRPVVKSASLRLNRVSGGLSSPAGDLRIGTWSQLNLESLPATTVNGTHHDWDPQTVNSVSGWSHGANRTFPVNVQQIYDHAAGKAIMFAEVISGYMTSGGTTNAYSRIYGLLGSDAAKMPLLTVTFDIV